MAEPTPTLFASLVERFGLNVALQLMPFLSGESSTASKAFAGTSLAGTSAKVAGSLSGSPSLSSLGGGISTGLGLASGGYGAYNAATDPNLSKTQQVGHSGRAVADTLMGIFIPYYGLAKAASIVGQIMQRSGSPQVAGAGRAVDQAAEPAGAKAFWNVAQGDMSPKAALAKAGPEGLVTDLLGPLGAMLKGIGADKKVSRGIMDFGPVPFGGKALSMLGIGSKPTTGTSFRNEVGSIFDRIPALKGTDTSKYNIDPGMYAGLPQAVKDNATALSQQLAGLAPHSQSNLQAYQNQIAAMLLNRFGANLPTGMV